MGFYETENMHFKEVFIMNEMKFLVSAKDIRKAACAVGFGLTIGKFAGDVVKDSILVLATGFLKHKAKKGDKVAQECCDEAKVKYDEIKEDR